MTLRDIYEAHQAQLAAFAASFPDEGLQGPLLLDPIAYHGQSTKLLVVGQETGGWLDDYQNIDAQFTVYRNFKLGEKWNSPFWSVTRKLESALGIEKCACAWTNLNRFDHDGEPPTGAVLAAMPALDFLVREEIEVLKPDVCVFYTNRKYDHRLAALYPGMQLQEVEGLPGRHFARLIHSALPALTLRTPHPRTMRMKGWEEPFLDVVRNLAPRSTSSDSHAQEA